MRSNCVRILRKLQEAGGEGGIRTPGTGLGQYDGLANRCFRPLSHLSGTAVVLKGMVSQVLSLPEGLWPVLERARRGKTGSGDSPRNENAHPKVSIYACPGISRVMYMGESDSTVSQPAKT